MNQGFSEIFNIPNIKDKSLINPYIYHLFSLKLIEELQQFGINFLNYETKSVDNLKYINNDTYNKKIILYSSFSSKNEAVNISVNLEDYLRKINKDDFYYNLLDLNSKINLGSISPLYLNPDFFEESVLIRFILSLIKDNKIELDSYIKEELSSYKLDENDYKNFINLFKKGRLFYKLEKPKNLNLLHSIYFSDEKGEKIIKSKLLRNLNEI